MFGCLLFCERHRIASHPEPKPKPDTFSCGIVYCLTIRLPSFLLAIDCECEHNQFFQIVWQTTRIKPSEDISSWPIQPGNNLSFRSGSNQIKS